MSFFIILLFAHLQAVFVPAWFAYRIKQKKTNLSPIMPSGGISLLQLAFTCFSIAALAEMLEGPPGQLKPLGPWALSMGSSLCCPKASICH